MPPFRRAPTGKSPEWHLERWGSWLITLQMQLSVLHKQGGDWSMTQQETQTKQSITQRHVGRVPKLPPLFLGQLRLFQGKSLFFYPIPADSFILCPLNLESLLYEKGLFLVRDSAWSLFFQREFGQLALLEPARSTVLLSPIIYVWSGDQAYERL